MLEHHVHALLSRQLAHDALEPVLAIVDDMVRTKRLGLIYLVVRAHRRDDRATHALCKLDRRGPDARAAGMNEDGFSGFELCVVKQHVLDGAESYRCDGRSHGVNAGRRRHKQPGRNIYLFLGEAIEMETVNSGHMFAQIVPTLTAGPAKPTGARPIYGNDLPRSEAGNAWANGLHFTGSLGTDDQRKLALGEGHAPPAPHIDVVQRHRPYAERHLAERR